MHQVCAATIWQGSAAINWNEGSDMSIDSSEFSNMQVGDILRISIDFTGQTAYPQISLRNGKRKDLAGTPGVALTADMTQVDFSVSRPMLTDIQKNGLIITGIGFTLTAIDIIEGDDGAEYEKAVWIGPTVFPSDWSVIQQLPASCFSDAATGQILRLCYKDLHVGAEATLRNSNWNEISGLNSYGQLSGNHTDLVITDKILEQLKREGCFVQGIAFTLTSVDIISQENLSTLLPYVPVVNEWMWSSPDIPRFRVDVTNPTAETVSFDIVVRIADDRLTTYQDYPFSETLAAGESHEFEYYPTKVWEPGFYQATILVNGEVARCFIFGYDAANIVIKPDMQDDFLDFWDTAKKELSQVDGQYTLTEIADQSSSQRKVYLLEMKSVPDDTGEGIVRAYYAEPTAAGTYPAVLHFCAYDGGGGLSMPRADDNPSQIDIVVSTRGQSINNRPPYTNNYGEWLTYGFGDKNTWYYRSAFMDCLRALDFLLTREKVQPQNIFAEGASQGGAFSIACAALGDGRINAIAPAVPFMGDFPYYFQLVVWADNVMKGQQRIHRVSDEEMYTMFSYFDTKNLATLINCPVLMNFSLQDNTCPPHTNWAAYNNFGSSEKHYLTNPTLGHTTAENWRTEYSSFFASHLKADANAVKNVPVSRQEDDAIYDLRGVRYHGSLSTIPSGIYIQQGRKIVK